MYIDTFYLYAETSYKYTIRIIDLMSTSLKNQDELNLSDLLRRDIEEHILTGHLKPGDRLDERALAEQHNVSRTPVREALLQLSSIGLVTARPRQGYIVTPLSFGRFPPMVEVMRFSEASAAQLAARR